MPISEHIVRYIRRIASPPFDGTPPDSAELAVDRTTNVLKYHSNGTHEAMALDLTQTITGNKTFSGTTTLSGSTTLSGAVTFTGATAGVRRATVVGVAAVVITEADSGTTYIATKATQSPDQIFTLPPAATPGLYYTFVCGHGTGEITVAVSTGDNILGKTHGAENGAAFATTATTGILINTVATNVIGDFCTLQSDGITSWYMTAVAGVWAAA